MSRQACAWKEAADALHERLLEEEATVRRAREAEQLAHDQFIHGRLLLLASAAEVLEGAPLDKLVLPRGRPRRARRSLRQADAIGSMAREHVSVKIFSSHGFEGWTSIGRSGAEQGGEWVRDGRK